MAPSASIWEPNLPSLPSGVSPPRFFSDSGSRTKDEFSSRWASATGTLIAALAALVSVYMIVLDEISAHHLECCHRFSGGCWGVSPAARRWYGQRALGTVHRWPAGQARSDAKRVIVGAG